MNSLTKIFDVRAQMIFNGRGEPTLEATISTEGGLGIASAPSGASKGKFEVKSYPNNSVQGAIDQVEKIVAPALLGKDADEQELIDQTLHDVDGTTDFSRIGGNTAYAISVAAADAAANSIEMPLFYHLSGSLVTDLPQPLGNVLGGGKHAGKKAPDIQEILVVTLNAPSFLDAAMANIDVHRKVGVILGKRDSNFTGGKGDEGGWAPNIDNEEALSIVSDACASVSEESGMKIGMGVDVAASSLWDPHQRKYLYPRDGKKFTEEEQIDFIQNLIREYKLVYAEDPLHEEDFGGFAELTRKTKDCLICGDDLYTSNVSRLLRGIEKGSGNAIIIKPNQIGTLTDAFKTTKMAKRHGFIPVASHRSGETNDSHLTHIAVAFGTPLIKLGVVGGERATKVNELVRIEKLLGKRARICDFREYM
ncbi:MAG TPA: enolase C-terminal domain-like protein [Candidatus Bathyarchaeia archaeon]|nr:enolase C-terminal domain-like protein [Candidatus Bathyarchaeia archaeon]